MKEGRVNASAVERRVALEKQRRVAEMSREEMQRALLTSEITGPSIQTSSFYICLGSPPPSTRLCTMRRLLLSRLDHSCELLQPPLAPFNLHNSRVRRASGFLLTAFSNATPQTFFQS